MSTTYLGTQAESVPIGESGTGVVENAGTVDFPSEVSGTLAVLGNDDICVPAAVFVNMIYSIVDVCHDLDRAFKGSILGLHAFRSWWPERQLLSQSRPGIYFHLKCQVLR